jgi:pimeloyl-ACP methyl ester carboxylesterase
VIIPGLQGRWEWMKPAIDALAQRARVITFSLADEPTARAEFDEAAGFRNYVEQVRDALDQCGIERAAIAGVSYGGLIAAAFAVRYPDRTASLILISALTPWWRPDARRTRWAALPWLFVPAFCARAVRHYREIAAAVDGERRPLTVAARIALTTMRYAFHPGRMGRRIRMLSSLRIENDLAGVQVPVLLLTGEDELDRVVPPSVTREYLKVWPRAQTVTFSRTGHFGLITRPEEFAALITRPWHTSSERSQARQAR